MDDYRPSFFPLIQIHPIMRIHIFPLLFCTLFLLFPLCICGQIDTTHIYQIDEVVVKENKKLKELRATTPIQQLLVEDLKRTGALQVSDAAKLFSGVVVKDYGGIGGLKTISIRSLGAAHTAVAYDGIAISDAQTGQIDLGKLSLDNVETLNLASGQNDDLGQPARLLASAGVLYLNTSNPQFNNKKINVNAGMKAGSFGFANPILRVENQWNKNLSSSVSIDYTHIYGAYPYKLSNGKATEKRYRKNSDVQSIKAEANLYAQMAGNRKTALKIYYYQSERGLPTNILYNTFAGQRLWDRNFFAQLKYDRNYNNRWSIRAHAKYNRSYNRYYDSSVLNINGYDNNHYYQDEYYLQATFSYRPISCLTFALANDGFINHMNADLDNFAIPTRFTMLNALSAKYIHPRITVTAHLLSTLTHENVHRGQAAPNRHRLSPAIGLSVQPFATNGFRIRVFYKDIFRLPTFNDLYYGTVGTRTLRPEKARQFNGGISWTYNSDSPMQNISISADAFFNRITDKIVAMPSKNLFVWSMLNVGQVDIKGTEANVSTEWLLHQGFTCQLTGNYTWQRALDKTSKDKLPYRTTYNHQIPYTPRHSGSVRFTLNTPWIGIGYTALFTGERYCNQYNSAEYHLEGYHEHSLTVWHERMFKKVHITLQAEALNIGGKQYEVVKNYPMPGRQFRASLHIRY